MAERVFPSTKPTTNGTTAPAAAAPGGGNSAFPATKAQMYNAARPAYRPPPRKRSRRSSCCSCCLWTTIAVVIIVFLAAVAAAIFYVLYRPQRPTFSLSSFQISQFNLTSSSQLTSKFNLTIEARNPNKKLVFFYEPISVSVFADGVDVGDGSIPAFEQSTKNTTALTTIIGFTGQTMDSTAISVVNSDLKNKNSLPLKIQIDTKIQAKIGKMKTKKIGIRIVCDGIKATVPTGKTATTAATASAKCTVDLRIKIWKWTF
ncbi:unnamed protein product [Camellia sinensis]